MANNNKLRGSYFISIISITLVLIMLGFLSMILLNTNNIANHAKESVGFTIMLNDDVSEGDIQFLKKQLDARTYIKSTRYVSKEEAKQITEEKLETEFADFVGYPIPASIEVSFTADYMNQDSIAVIAAELEQLEEVREAYYDPVLIQKVNENISKISSIVLGFSLLLLLVAVGLINNTIRLSIYSKRFLMRSMKLFGATDSFVMKPFINKSILQAIIAGILANLILYFGIIAVQNEIPDLVEIQDIDLFLILFSLCFVFSLLISIISTYFAVKRYLKMDIDKLYN